VNLTPSPLSVGEGETLRVAREVVGVRAVHELPVQHLTPGPSPHAERREVIP